MFRRKMSDHEELFDAFIAVKDMGYEYLTEFCEEFEETFHKIKLDKNLYLCFADGTMYVLKRIGHDSRILYFRYNYSERDSNNFKFFAFLFDQSVLVVVHAFV